MIRIDFLAVCRFTIAMLTKVLYCVYLGVHFVNTLIKLVTSVEEGRVKSNIRAGSVPVPFEMPDAQIQVTKTYRRCLLPRRGAWTRSSGC